MLEVCVETIAGLEAAVRGGADRIEVCAALSVGGLTPPGSLIRAAAAVPLPVHLLARPRAGGFIHDAAEQALIADDIRAAAEAGLAGVVIGASAADRQLDTAALARWIEHARTLGQQRGAPLSLTLHRAFDLVPDPLAALEQAVALGFDRILTSGGQPRAIDGVATLAALHRQGGGADHHPRGQRRDGRDRARLVGDRHCRTPRILPRHARDRAGCSGTPLRLHRGAGR